MVTILLSGSLAKRFGRCHKRYLESGTLREALSALQQTLEGFTEFIRESDLKGIRYAIFRNRENISEECFSLAGSHEIRIVPVVSGRKKGGVMQTVLGGALIAAAAVMTGGASAAFAAGGLWGGVAIMGASLALGGAMQLLSPQPKGLKGRSAPENTPSHGFGGPVNTVAQGYPVPVPYGEREIGGAVISAGIYPEDKM